MCSILVIWLHKITFFQAGPEVLGYTVGKFSIILDGSFSFLLTSYALSSGEWLRAILKSQEAQGNAESAQTYVRHLGHFYLNVTSLLKASGTTIVLDISPWQEWDINVAFWSMANPRADMKSRGAITSALCFSGNALLALPVKIRDSQEVPKSSWSFFFNMGK